MTRRVLSTESQNVESGMLQDDLREMLRALSLPDGAQPKSPHEVFADALREMRHQLAVGREQHEIVARIWRQLGSPTYKELGGRTIYDLIGEWKPIDQAPLNVNLLLGWWQKWPRREWVQVVGWAGASNTKPPGMSNAWRHGEATHWRVLFEPPDALPQAESAGVPVVLAEGER